MCIQILTCEEIELKLMGKSFASSNRFDSIKIQYVNPQKESLAEVETPQGKHSQEIALDNKF